jgi:predicted DNA-binding helix-hairpin-helix protein
MDVRDKLDILSRDAQYDLSCACGTKNVEEHRFRGDNNSWVYPVTVASGGSGIILKTLLSNMCSSDCRYCPLRENVDSRRVSLSPDEIAKFFINFISHRPLIGIFLSSGIIRNADYTMDRLIGVATLLRYRYRYKGYIHIKIIPGASRAAIDSALSVASAVSLNIEAPGEKHFQLLSSKKRYQTDIIQTLQYISQQIQQNSRFKRVHTTSQFIVGASDESDKEILNYTYGMYDRLRMGRLYFSAYQAGLGEASLPGEIRRIEKENAPFTLSGSLTDDSLLNREHRLYQADFLFRQYKFTYDDLIFDQKGNLDLSEDPKMVWAHHHPEFFPISVKNGKKEELLKVPGIGPATANKIVKLRRETPISDLTQLYLPRHLYYKASKYLTI